jgi:hypothetical protein
MRESAATNFWTSRATVVRVALRADAEATAHGASPVARRPRGTRHAIPAAVSLPGRARSWRFAGPWGTGGAGKAADQAHRAESRCVRVARPVLPYAFRPLACAEPGSQVPRVADETRVAIQRAVAWLTVAALRGHATDNHSRKADSGKCERRARPPVMTRGDVRGRRRRHNANPSAQFAVSVKLPHVVTSMTKTGPVSNPNG